MGNQSHVTVRVPPKRRHSASVIALAPSPLAPFHALRNVRTGCAASHAPSRSLAPIYSSRKIKPPPTIITSPFRSFGLNRFKPQNSLQLLRKFRRLFNSSSCSPPSLSPLPPVLRSCLAYAGFDLNRSECPSGHLDSRGFDLDSGERGR
jgi:hypothetical protein